MAFSIVNNLASLTAQNRLTTTQLGLQQTIGRLSSGLRINSAADDASGLAIADRLKSDISALGQADRNANDGISVVQVADGALSQVSGLLQRAVTLAEQAASDTSGSFGGASKAALNGEYQEILREVNRISDTTAFNGKVIFGSAGVSLSIQVGTGTTASDSISITTTALSATGLALTASGTGQAVTTSALNTSTAVAQAEIGKLQTAIDNISTRRASLGSSLNRLTATASVITTTAQNLQAAESQIRDANIAQEVTNLSKFQVLQQTGLAALSQANSSNQAVLSLLR
jgi:flagellin